MGHPERLPGGGNIIPSPGVVWGPCWEPQHRALTPAERKGRLQETLAGCSPGPFHFLPQSSSSGSRQHSGTGQGGTGSGGGWPIFSIPGLLHLFDARSTCSRDDYQCPQMSPGVPWGQNCPGREPLDVKVWLTFWVFSLQVYQEAGAHLEGSCPRWGERHSFIHSLICSVCQATNVVIVFLDTRAKEPRDMSPFLESLSSGVSL